MYTVKHGVNDFKRNIKTHFKVSGDHAISKVAFNYFIIRYYNNNNFLGYLDKYTDNKDKTVEQAGIKIASKENIPTNSQFDPIDDEGENVSRFRIRVSDKILCVRCGWDGDAIIKTTCDDNTEAG